jgi:hypothetical protein
LHSHLHSYQQHVHVFQEALVRTRIAAAAAAIGTAAAHGQHGVGN